MGGRLRPRWRMRGRVFRARVRLSRSAGRSIRARGATRLRTHERSAHRGAARMSAKPAPRKDAFDAAAVPLDGVSVIEANAGTGKTWTITALYVRLLLELGLTVESILVVT